MVGHRCITNLQSMQKRRAVPGKRGMAAMFAVLGSTFSGLMHYIFGRWIPTFEQLVSSKVALSLSFSERSNHVEQTQRLILDYSLFIFLHCLVFPANRAALPWPSSWPQTQPPQKDPRPYALFRGNCIIVPQVAMAYLGLSGLVGLAVTYYYDNEANAKAQTILKYGMKLLGLAAVATSTSLPQASAALAAGLVALDVGLHMISPRRVLPPYIHAPHPSVPPLLLLHRHATCTEERAWLHYLRPVTLPACTHPHNLCLLCSAPSSCYEASCNRGMHVAAVPSDL